MNRVSVRQTEDRFLWRVTFGCCDARPLRFHDRTLAMQNAHKHVSDYHAPQVLTAGADSSPGKTVEKHTRKARR